MLGVQVWGRRIELWNGLDVCIRRQGTGAKRMADSRVKGIPNPTQDLSNNLAELNHWHWGGADHWGYWESSGSVSTAQSGYARVSIRACPSRSLRAHLQDQLDLGWFQQDRVSTAIIWTRQSCTIRKAAEWLEFQNKTGPDYYIADKTKYTKFIRKFHLTNLQNAKDVFWTPSLLDITKVMAVISPPDIMLDPSEAQEDLRETLDVNRQLASGKRLRSPEKIAVEPA